MQEITILVTLASYLAGSIPFGLIIPKMMGLGDVRKIGSKNIGATNATRLAGKKIGALILLLDGIKGAIPVLLTKYWIDDISVVALVGGAAVIGHIFPVWLKFKGGKGVATTAFILLATNVYVAMVTIGVWITIYMITRISSLSSLVSSVGSLVAAYFLSAPQIFTMVLFMVTLIVIRHKSNILRLLKGQEGKV